MFIVDAPDAPAEQIVTPISSEARYQTIGICHLAENPSAPDNAANMLSVTDDVTNYFADRHWKFSGPVIPQVRRVPRHGTLTQDYPGLFTYHPRPEYLGPDQVTIIAKVGQKTLRMEYFIRVLHFVPVDDAKPDMYERGYCPVNSRVWEIRTHQ
jgi:hypothetical protein